LPSRGEGPATVIRKVPCVGNAEKSSEIGRPESSRGLRNLVDHTGH